jgi:hypothetical protein
VPVQNGRMVRRLRWIAVAATLAAASLAGCGSDGAEPAPAGSDLGPRPWPGRLVVATLGTDRRGAVLELVHDGAGGARIARRLATTAGGAGSLSADGATLLFRAESGLIRHDVAGNAGRQVEVRVDGVPVRITSECLQFAPNGQRFLAKDAEGRLLAVDATAGAKADPVVADAVVVDAPKRERYVEIGGSRSTEGVSAVDCGRWLDDQRVVFDHVRAMPGSLPGNQMTGAEVPLAAEDTALAVLTGTGVRLVESASPWRPVGTCGSWTLTRRGGAAYQPATYLWNGVPEEALAIDEGVTPDARLIRPGPAMDTYAAATFLPSCDVFVVAQAKESVDRLAYRRVSPATGAAADGPSTLRAAEGVPRLEPGGIAWSPGADPAMYVEISDRYDARLFVTEIATGQAASIAVPEPGRVVAILGWLP